MQGLFYFKYFVSCHMKKLFIIALLLSGPVKENTGCKTRPKGCPVGTADYKHNK